MKTSILRDFPRTFWTANVMELFERAAYYGLMSVLAVYLTNRIGQGGLGFSESSVGFLLGIVYAAVYIVPILGGALADRYGYRRMLLAAFSLLTAGYFAAGFMSGYALVFLALLVMAVGAGLFKPIISGTIARTTDERTSSLGFGIYYWMINVGAFAAPLVVSWLKDPSWIAHLGVFPVPLVVSWLQNLSWRAIFFASALYTGAMLLPALFLFRDPPLPGSRKTLREVMVGAVEVLSDARFMLMIILYSGFWILYFQQFGSILWYLRDFVVRAPVSAAVTHLLHAVGLNVTFVFDAEHVTVIDAGMIILLQVLVSRIVRDRRALPTMVVGMLIGGAGLACLAISPNPWVFVCGIAVFAIGEMTAHPKYYSFIGLVAPPDRKAVYMGYSFLYGVIGGLLGSFLGGTLYEGFLKPVIGAPGAFERARWFWLLFVAVDVVAIAGLVLFERAFGKDTAETRRGARLAMFGVYAVFILLGAALLWLAFRGTEPNFKMAIQAGIFVLLGGGGLVMNARRRPA
jgi:proton-dependent oligopeptide transporter, POT family